MRFVLDTNVLMSGLFFGGKPGQILDWWLSSGCTLVVSAAVLNEYRDVLERLALRYPGVQARSLFQMVSRRCLLINAVPVPLDACVDVHDLKFLECALGGQSRLIISGDRHLLNVNGWRKIRVVNPATFVDSIMPEI